MVKIVNHIGGIAETDFSNLFPEHNGMLYRRFGKKVDCLTSYERYFLFQAQLNISENIDRLTTWNHIDVVTSTSGNRYIKKSTSILPEFGCQYECLNMTDDRNLFEFESSFECHLEAIDFVDFMRDTDVFETYAEKAFSSMFNLTFVSDHKFFWELCSVFKELNVDTNLSNKIYMLEKGNPLVFKTMLFCRGIYKNRKIDKISIQGKDFILFQYSNL